MSFPPSDLCLSEFDFSEGEISRLVSSVGGTVDAMEAWGHEVPQTGTHVQTVAFPGEYNFQIAVEESSSRSYVYSTQLNRLYIDMNKVAPIKFMWQGPSTLHVRAMLVYKEPDYEKISVTRCRTHEDNNDNSNTGYSHPSHVLRCDDEKTVYTENNSSGRKSVITVLDHIPPGTDGRVVHYRLMCKTSCVGGINRRKTDIIFTLEDSNCQIVGRAVLGIKVCSCPRRDKEKDEIPDGKKKRKESSLTRTPVKLMKKEADTEPCQVYQVRIPQSRVWEFESYVTTLLASTAVPPEVAHQVTEGAIIKL